LNTPPDYAQPRPALLELGAALSQASYAFVTISTPSHRRVNGRPGNELATDLRGVFGWSRPFGDEVLAPRMLAAMREAGILRQHEGHWKSTLRASTLGGRLYFHSAFPTRETDAVFFGPDTYRYVQVLDDFLRTSLASLPPAMRAVDIGCGAGPGAVTIAAALPQAEVWAVDINPRALELTAVNARLAGAGNVRVAHSDLLDGVAGQFDLIVSNPPFMLDAGQRTYCHGGGMLGEGLSLDIVACALARLAPGGTLLLYTCVAIIDGADPFRERVKTMLDAGRFDWRYREIDPDVFGGELGDPAHRHTDRIAAIALYATLTDTELPCAKN
jgi:SAM-dependent methyltransferase